MNVGSIIEHIYMKKVGESIRMMGKNHSVVLFLSLLDMMISSLNRT